MLLETLENKAEDIIIYSRNILSNDDNFRMILKNDPERTSRKLFLYDVTGLVNHPVHKNLIMYRLLTNLDDLNIEKTELGSALVINDKEELLYPDPIYAVKELENLSMENYLPNLRFRIQQIGLTTSSVEKGKVHFRELFYFDLDSLEAQAQNDSVYLPALLLDKKIDKKVILENISDVDPKYSVLKSLDDDDDGGDITPKYTALSHYPINESDIKRKSSIEIFNFPKSLGEIIKKKVGKQKILKFR